MNRLTEKYEKELLESEYLGYNKTELYEELLIEKLNQEQINECEDILINLMGRDEVKKLSKGNFDMIVIAMHEYAENFKNR
tara:strand:- start:160 stop:402 length:243 start_codon:yes stop_codon:yes gene_type:complete